MKALYNWMFAILQMISMSLQLMEKRLVLYMTRNVARSDSRISVFSQCNSQILEDQDE